MGWRGGFHHSSLLLLNFFDDPDAADGHGFVHGLAHIVECDEGGFKRESLLDFLFKNRGKG